MSDRAMSAACTRVRDRIPALLDETLAPLEAARDGGHMEACVGCRTARDEHRLLLTSIRESSQARTGPLEGLEEEILRSLPARPLRRRAVAAPKASWGWAAAAAVVLACAWELTQGAGLQPGSAELTGLDPVLARLPGWTHVSSGLDHLSHWISRG